MITVVRLAAFSIALIALQRAPAQLPIAPPPHPTLEGLVEEYKRLGLPLPPPNAELVRYLDQNRMWLGFRWNTGKPDDQPAYLVKADDRWSLFARDRKTPVVMPRVEELNRIESDRDMDWVTLAVQCKVRGWNDLAQAAYARRGVEFTKYYEYGEPQGKLSLRPIHVERCSLIEALRDEAWHYWNRQLHWEEKDRKTILQYMKRIYPDNDVTRDLERTLAPRKSKAGSVESLIDDLVDFDNSEYVPGERTMVRKIEETSFDAVPALIEHMNDRRFTRSYGGTLSQYKTRVGDLCTGILWDLFDNPEADFLFTPEEALRFYGRAQAVGEERWLLDHAFSTVRTGGDPEGELSTELIDAPNFVMLRAIAGKYPHRLAPLYQTYLYKLIPIPALEQEFWNIEFPSIIRDSRLPRDKKIALLVEGASHPRFEASFPALSVLSDVDGPTFHRMLRKTLRSYSKIPDLRDLEAVETREHRLVAVVNRTRDPAIWDELDALARRSSHLQRTWLIKAMTLDTMRSRATAADRIRFLLRFVNDEDVRDTATEVLAEIVGLHDDYESSTVSQLVFRARVVAEAQKELKRWKP